MGRKTYECENCERTFQSKAIFHSHQQECREPSTSGDDEEDEEMDIDSNTGSATQDVVMKETQITTTSTQNIQMSEEEEPSSNNVGGGGSTFAAAAAVEDLYARSAIQDVIVKKEPILIQCKRCRKDMINEAHLQAHVCQPKMAELTGTTLEERKQQLFYYYSNAFTHKRTEIFQRVFPVFTYQAMTQLGKDIVDVPDAARTIHESIKETTEEIDIDFDRKRQMLVEKYEKEVLKIPKTIRCQHCDQSAKYYCCEDGCYCSEECQVADFHYIDCGKILNDSLKDASIPRIKRIPALKFDH